MNWGAIASLVGTGAQLYNQHQARKAAKRNPGVAGQNAVMQALMDPTSPTYQRMLAEETDRQYGNIIDYIKKSDLMRRRAAARGDNFSRSEREDEARYKALAMASRKADITAQKIIENRLLSAAGVGRDMTGGYNEQQRQLSGSRAATTNAMVDLMKNIGGQYNQWQADKRGDGIDYGGLLDNNSLEDVYTWDVDENKFYGVQ